MAVLDKDRTGTECSSATFSKRLCRQGDGTGGFLLMQGDIVPRTLFTSSARRNPPCKAH